MTEIFKKKFGVVQIYRCWFSKSVPDRWQNLIYWKVHKIVVIECVFKWFEFSKYLFILTLLCIFIINQNPDILTIFSYAQYFKYKANLPSGPIYYIILRILSYKTRHSHIYTFAKKRNATNISYETKTKRAWTIAGDNLTPKVPVLKVKYVKNVPLTMKNGQNWKTWAPYAIAGGTFSFASRPSLRKNNKIIKAARGGKKGCRRHILPEIEFIAIFSRFRRNWKVCGVKK